MQQITIDGNLSIVPTIPERSNAPSVGTNELWDIAGLTDTSLNAPSVGTNELWDIAGLTDTSLNAPSVGTNLSFRLFVSFEEQLDVRGWSVRPSLDSTEEERKKGDIAVETVEKSPLLALAGTVKCTLSEIELAPVPEIREIPPERRKPVKPGTSPLLALAGTLECNVTDISERHDEYLVDMLVAELRGNDDE